MAEDLDWRPISLKRSISGGGLSEVKWTYSRAVTGQLVLDRCEWVDSRQANITEAKLSIHSVDWVCEAKDLEISVPTESFLTDTRQGYREDFVVRADGSLRRYGHQELVVASNISDLLNTNEGDLLRREGSVSLSRYLFWIGLATVLACLAVLVNRQLQSRAV